MASYRKHKKATWMNVRKMIKDIKSYRHKFEYKYGYGYFIFSFDSGEYNLHITFDKLPDIKFGIWKTNAKYHFFAEHICWIDKFKPSRVNFNWESLDEMMSFVDNCIKSEDYYYTQMLESYDTAETKEEFIKRVNEDKFYVTHNHFSPEEYHHAMTKFYDIIRNLDVEKYDIIWTESSAFRTTYDVYFYAENTLTDDEINDFENQLEDCYCNVWGTSILSPSYWNHRSKYRMKVHPENKELYTNRVKHNRYFRKLKR